MLALNMTFGVFRFHRDTTVQSLTLQPNVQDGVIIYEDSPLVSTGLHIACEQALLGVEMATPRKFAGKLNFASS